MATRPRSTLKGDAYRAYEALPAEVRLALQESLVDWCPMRAREWHLYLLNELRLRPAQAAHVLVQTIRKQDHAEVAAFARTWAKGAEAYPHVAAGATIQRYAGTEGIPAPEPMPAAPRKQPGAAKAKPARVKPGRAKAVRPKDARAKPARAKPVTAKAPARPSAKRKPGRRARR